MQKKTSRRDFLTGTACATGAVLGAGSFTETGGLYQLAQAAEKPGLKDRYYVFVYFSGAWDILLGLDPRDPNIDIGVKKIQPGYQFLVDNNNDGSPKFSKDGSIMLGPYIGDLLNHLDKVAVVRGISMDTLTHEVGRRRFITGKPPSGLLARGSSVATWIAGQVGGSHPIPNLSAQVETYNTDQPNWATGLKVASVPDLVRSLERGDPSMQAQLDLLVNQLLAGEAECGKAQKSPQWQKAEESRLKGREMVSAGYGDLFAFQDKTPQMNALREHYGIGATGAAALQTPEAQAAMASTALTSGISRVVSFQAASGLDTHFDDWEDEQGPTQERGFNAVARLMEDLANRDYKGTGDSWLDHTTIVGFSEFCRTAMLNTRGGRDHHLLNAAFVAGAGIKGNQVVGASTDVAMMPQATDLLTGMPSQGGEVVKPEHILQALLYDLGIEGDPADLRVDPLKALLKNP